MGNNRVEPEASTLVPRSGRIDEVIRCVRDTRDRYTRFSRWLLYIKVEKYSDLYRNL